VRRIKRLDEGVRLRVDDEDDLWTVSQLCRPGTNVGMLSHRRDSATGTQSDSRAKSAERKPMWIVLEVQETAFQPFTDNLRVHGVITEAKIDIGSHHTHVMSPGSVLELTREGGLPAADRALLREALSAGRRAKCGLLVVESDEILVFQVAAHGIRDVSQFTMRGGGKKADDSTSVRRGFFERVAKETRLVFKDHMPLVICGPGMAREQFEAHLRGQGAQNQILNTATSIGGRSAANEVLAEGLADSVLGEHSLIQQVRAIEEGLKRISTGGAVSYGPAAIAEAAEQGAVETLIIEASMLRSGEDEARERWERTAASVEGSGGSIIQASVDHDSGQQLLGFGGAIALLRWKTE
jgi:protein pelota